MFEILQSPTAQLVIGLAGLAMLVALGYYVVLKFRDSSDGIENAAELLTKFRELRQEGHINDEEYRTIRTDLEGKLSTQADPDLGNDSRLPSTKNLY